MSIASKLEKLQTDITSAYSAISTKGGTVPNDKNTENMVNAITSIVSPEETTGNTANEYVSAYVTAALASYPNDTARETTVVTDYYMAISGVRKDEPLPLSTTLPAGELVVKDNTSDTSIKSTVSSGNNSVYNVSPEGADYIVKSSGDIVAVGTLNPTNTVRMIYAPSVYNIRDLGGWSCYKNNGTAEGTIKYGKLFRGSEINNNISSADKKIFKDFLNIRAEIDFYNTYTSEEEVSILGDEIKFYNCRTNGFYTTLVDLTDSTKIATIKKAIEGAFYCAKNNLPLYFHCQVGADRTGTLAFILGAMLGMNEVELDIEWELTSFSAVTPSSSLSAGARTRNGSGDYSTKYRQMIAYFKTCTTNPTSIRDAVVAWAVLAGIDIADINEFRSNMIDGTPETVTALIAYDATGITLDKSSIELNKNSTTTIVATVTPSWSTSSVTWSSSDTSIATISANGKTCTVTGVAAGDITITATTNSHTATCSVTVSDQQEQPQYTGNILTTVGYEDGKRYSSTGELEEASGYFASGKIPFYLQSDGKFKLRFTSTQNNFTTSSYTRLITYVTEGSTTSFRAYKTFKQNATDTGNGIQIEIIDANTVDVTFTAGSQKTISEIGFTAQSSGSDVTIEQIFPIVINE